MTMAVNNIKIIIKLDLINTRQMHSIVGASLSEARGMTDIDRTLRVACYAAIGEQLQMWNRNEMHGIDF